MAEVFDFAGERRAREMLIIAVAGRSYTRADRPTHAQLAAWAGEYRHAFGAERERLYHEGSAGMTHEAALRLATKMLSRSGCFERAIGLPVGVYGPKDGNAAPTRATIEPLRRAK